MTVNTLEVFLIVSDELCYEPLSSAGGGGCCCLIYNWTEEKKRTELSWIWTGQMWKRSEERGGRGGGGLLYNIYLFCGVLTLNVLGFFFTSIQQLSDEAKAQRKKKIFQEWFQIISYVTCLSLILKQFQFHWEMRHSGTSGKGKHISISTELTCLKKKYIFKYNYRELKQEPHVERYENLKMT